MSLQSTHPLYQQFSADWVMMRDLLKGERTVKAKGSLYLPPTDGMELDGMKAGQDGKKAYDAYLARAVFPDYVKEGVASLVGIMHKKPPVIELPAALEPLRLKATQTGEGLVDLLRYMNSEQLLEGRIGLLADLPITEVGANVSTIPYIATYIAESIINWDEATSEEGFSALNMVVLDESGFIRAADLTWKTQKKFRLLQLGPLDTNEPEGEYRVGVFTDANGATLTPSEELMKVPAFKGNTLKSIPFVFANARDITASPEDPPLISLGRLCLAIYRGEADYRQNLHMQGQDTLVVVGGTRAPEAVPGQDAEALRIGAGSRIDVDIQGDAKFIGVSGKGLSEQREALTCDREEAQAKAGKLIPSKASAAESGEALKTRVAAQTATLTEVAIAGAKALENLLKQIAMWCGADPSQVVVTPNLEFADLEFMAQELVQLMTARGLGAPISRQSIHEVMKDRGLTKMSYEDELAIIEEENASLPPAPGTVGGPHPRLDPNADPNASGN